MNLEVLLIGAGLLPKHGGLVWRISATLCAIRRNEMVFSTETVQYIEPTRNKHPFCIVTVSGRRCECPIYLDYAQTAVGQEMTCLTVRDTHFAFRAPSEE